MSAPPPPAPPSGAAAPPGNGAPRPQVIARKPATANPLVARKKPRPKPALSRPPAPAAALAPSKGGPVAPKKPILNDPNDPKMRQLAQTRAQNGGWSEQVSAKYTEFPLVVTKKSLLEGIRHHIMRLNKGKGEPGKAKGDAIVDVTNQDQFPRPVTLLRRDPRLPPAHRMAVKEESTPPPLDPAAAAEYERARQLKAEKEAQRALDQAQIAPVLRGSNDPKPTKKDNQKKDKPIAFYGRNSDMQKKESKIHYEETWPWHLEDAEGKSGVWVGSYIASLSDLNVALVIDGARFRMIPLERFYRFDEKPKFETLSLDDAEKLMYEVKEVKRWVMKQKEQEQLEREKSETRQFLRGPARVKTESLTSRLARRSERQDDFELDMEGDEFQDDDEAPNIEGDEDEDTKEAKERIRREQVQANTFGEGEEAKVEQEERELQLERLRAKMIGKQTVKTLKKLEHAHDFDDFESGSEENNPFTDASVRRGGIRRRGGARGRRRRQKGPGRRLGGHDQGQHDALGPAEGGRRAQEGQQAQEAWVPQHVRVERQRGGPQEAQDDGGQGLRRAQPRRHPIPGRPKPPAAGSSAMSDGEATAGEMSDAPGAKLKQKFKAKTVMRPAPGATPSGSRAGSPAPGGGGSAAAAKPTGTPSGSPPPTGQAPDKIQPKEIADAIATHAKDGIALPALFQMFQKRINKPGHMTKTEWIQWVKNYAVYGPDKLLRPKAGSPAPV
ncbi:hypothetical protein VTJ83DRAFT_4827 [Remersonia thermophila]|uniref:Transcription initiation factor IIF subunit alpha n=1 Tax=Remersonia thermophila TaxID=72144 RepID=A0ABR4DB21_9PEZI